METETKTRNPRIRKIAKLLGEENWDLVNIAMGITSFPELETATTVEQCLSLTYDEREGPPRKFGLRQEAFKKAFLLGPTLEQYLSICERGEIGNKRWRQAFEGAFRSALTVGDCITILHLILRDNREKRVIEKAYSLASTTKELLSIYPYLSQDNASDEHVASKILRCALSAALTFDDYFAICRITQEGCEEWIQAFAGALLSASTFTQCYRLYEIDKSNARAINKAISLATTTEDLIYLFTKIKTEKEDLFEEVYSCIRKIEEILY